MEKADIVLVEEPVAFNELMADVYKGKDIMSAVKEARAMVGDSRFTSEPSLMALFGAIAQVRRNDEHAGGVQPREFLGHETPKGTRALAWVAQLKDSEARENYFNAFLDNDTEVIKDSFIDSIAAQAVYNAQHDQLLLARIRQTRQDKPAANILIVRGDFHTQPFIELKKESPDDEITRAFINALAADSNIYPLEIALMRKVAFEIGKKELTAPDVAFNEVFAEAKKMIRAMPGEDLVKAIASHVIASSLPLTVESSEIALNFAKINILAQRVTLEQFARLGESNTVEIAMHSIASPELINKSIQNWLVGEGIATREDLVQAFGSSSAAMARVKAMKRAG